MTALPFPVWFVRRVPVESIRGGKPVPSLVAKEIWFPPLLLDIEKRGLQNPLLIVSHHPRTTREHQWIRVGMNRLHALKTLGWTHVPCIITGRIDKWELPNGESLELQGVLLETVEEVNTYFCGGRFKLYQNHEVGFGNDLIPEKGKYPTARRAPYFKDDASPGLVRTMDADDNDPAPLDAPVSGQAGTGTG